MIELDEVVLGVCLYGEVLGSRGWAFDVSMLGTNAELHQSSRIMPNTHVMYGRLVVQPYLSVSRIVPVIRVVAPKSAAFTFRPHCVLPRPSLWAFLPIQAEASTYVYNEILIVYWYGCP